MIFQSPPPVTVDGGDQGPFRTPEDRRTLQVGIVGFQRTKLASPQKIHDSSCSMCLLSVVYDKLHLVFRHIASTHPLAGMVRERECCSFYSYLPVFAGADCIV
jgi:hypothetical protein